MLNLYSDKKFIPDGIELIRGNDAFFNINTRLRDERFVWDALETVERAKYFNEVKFLSQFDGTGVPHTHLSTGCKSVLNAYFHPDMCIDTVECGWNAVDFALRNLSEGSLFVYPKLFFGFPEDREFRVNGVVACGWERCSEVLGLAADKD